MVKIPKEEPVKLVGIRIVVGDENNYRERYILSTWLKQLSLEDFLDEIEIAIEKIE